MQERRKRTEVQFSDEKDVTDEFTVKQVLL